MACTPAQKGGEDFEAGKIEPGTVDVPGMCVHRHARTRNPSL